MWHSGLTLARRARARGDAMMRRGGALQRARGFIWYIASKVYIHLAEGRAAAESAKLSLVTNDVC